MGWEPGLNLGELRLVNSNLIGLELVSQRFQGCRVWADQITVDFQGGNCSPAEGIPVDYSFDLFHLWNSDYEKTGTL